MKKIVTCLLLCSSFISADIFSQKPVFDQTAGSLRLAIDRTGKIVVLEDATAGVNYIDNRAASYLLSIRKYSARDSSAMFTPRALKVIEQTSAGSKLELSYDEGIKLSVLIIRKPGYFRIELTGAGNAKNIRQISWGPYRTTMNGLIGNCIGFNRSDQFSVGLLSLEPNTDGYLSNYSVEAAFYTAKGSGMQLTAFDHTRGQFVKSYENGHEDLRKALPVPGLTVIGSAIALTGCPSGDKNELAMIEKVELGEKLPHPEFEGKWNKYSRQADKLNVWSYNYSQQNFAGYLDISKEMGAKILYRNPGFFKNWGHF
ncbi:MAG: hypothetical protein H0X41_12025, partial [Chitinophagaceae bacterium]|nr:hypothetical protein [Chitinophagaceae bacterium]